MGFFAWLKSWFQPLIRALWSMLKELISGGTELVLAQLRELAINAVMMVASDPKIITDEDKRKTAFEIIKGKAIERGLTTRDSLINFALELSLNYLKQTGRLP